MNVDLLRHGDTGQSGFRGQLDDALSESGWTQMHAAVCAHAWDLVLSSSLQRCATFAAQLAQARSIPLRIDARLMEFDFGRWQGVPLQHISRDEPEALARFWADPWQYPPPGSEGLAAFRQRLSDALDAAAVHLHEAARVLVITHGGAIRLLRCVVESREFSEMAGIDVPHASLHSIRWARTSEA